MIKIKTPEELIENKKAAEESAYKSLVEKLVSQIESQFKGKKLNLKATGKHEFLLSIRERLADDFCGSGWRVSVLAVSPNNGEQSEAQIIVDPDWLPLEFHREASVLEGGDR